MLTGPPEALKVPTAPVAVESVQSAQFTGAASAAVDDAAMAPNAMTICRNTLISISDGAMQKKK